MNSPMFAQRTSGNSAKAPAEPYAACGAAHGLSLPFGNSRLWPSTELYYANFSKFLQARDPGLPSTQLRTLPGVELCRIDGLTCIPVLMRGGSGQVTRAQR